MYNPPLGSSVHFSDLGGRRAISCRIRIDLFRSVLFYTEELPKAEMEPREAKQALPVYWYILERLGCCNFILSLRISRYRPDIKL